MNKFKSLWQYALFRYIFIVAVLEALIILVYVSLQFVPEVVRGGFLETLMPLPPLLMFFVIWRRLFARIFLRLVRTVNKAAE